METSSTTASKPKNKQGYLHFKTLKIMNKPVDYQLATLLKEKGYDEKCPHIYSAMEGQEGLLVTLYREKIRNSYGPRTLTAPTISEIIMWLHEKHGIWIWVSMELGYTNTFCWQLTGEHTSSNYKAFFKSPTEAYADAITYTLNNLI